MSDPRFARKEIPSPRLPHAGQDSPLMCLVRCMFGLPKPGDTQALDDLGVAWEGQDYAPKEFMAAVGRSQYDIYHWLDPDDPKNFPAQYLPDFVAFVRQKSLGMDVRLVNYFAALSGLSVIPMTADADKVRAILNIIEGK